MRACWAAGAEVQIHTFHAWFAQLLRLAPLEMLDALGLHPAMSLIEEVDDQLGELLRRFQREVLNDVLVVGGLPDLDRASRSLAARPMVARCASTGAWRSSGPIHAARCSRRSSRRRSAGRRARALSHPLQRIADDAALRRLLGRAVEALGTGPGKAERKAGEALAAALDLADAQVALAEARRALFTKEGVPRKLGSAPAVRAAVEALLELEQQVMQQDAHDDHLRMVRLSRLLLGCWQALKRERALMDMQDLERGALALLADPVTSGWVQQRLDARLRHVLIDEFQDTSTLQWQALQGWLTSYAGAGGGASGQQPLSVFIVGDPKQSIYRFRGAEPRVFAAARRFVVDGLAGHDLACNHTRRNAPAVIDAVNAVFGQAVTDGDYDGFMAHSTQRAGESHGQVRHLDDPPAR